MKVNKTAVSSLLLSTDTNLRNALSYLLSVVLRHQFEIFESSKDIQARMYTRDLVFLHVTAGAEPFLDLVAEGKALKPAPVMIVLQDPEANVGALAFVSGADDVVTWPCSLHELAARVMVRLGQTPDEATLLADMGNWQAEAYIAEQAGLTLAEAQVMCILYRRDGEIVSRDELSLALDSRPWRYGDRKFDVHVAKIRKKLSTRFGSGVTVTTIRSSGYQLVSNSDDLFPQG